MTPRPPDTPSAVLDFADDCRAGAPAFFTNPVEIVSAHSHDEVRPALRRVEGAAARGLYAVGFVAYEAAPAFDRALTVKRQPAGLPLLWFGLFERPSEVEPAAGEFRVSDWTPSVTRAEYERNVEAVRDAIARGDTYQVNYTLRLRARFEGTTSPSTSGCARRSGRASAHTSTPGASACSRPRPSSSSAAAEGASRRAR